MSDYFLINTCEKLVETHHRLLETVRQDDLTGYHHALDVAKSLVITITQLTSVGTDAIRAKARVAALFLTESPSILANEATLLMHSLIADLTAEDTSRLLVTI